MHMNMFIFLLLFFTLFLYSGGTIEKASEEEEIKDTIVVHGMVLHGRVMNLGSEKLSFKLLYSEGLNHIAYKDIDSWIKDYTVDLLKTEMDGIRENKGMITMLTSNFPEDMPKALIDRPGRFSDILNYEYPDKEIA